jgi:hypothetical protein
VRPGWVCARLSFLLPRAASRSSAPRRSARTLLLAATAPTALWRLQDFATSTKLPCSPCDVTVVKQRSKPGREWKRGKGRGGRRGRGRGRSAPGAARGRTQKPSLRRRACPAAKLPPKFGVHRNANRAAFLPAGEWGAGGGGGPFLPSGSPRIWGVEWRWLCRGQLGERAGHTQSRETAWRGNSGAQ